MTRNRSKFTKQQVDAFQANPYTYRISESTIRFTLEFKKEFWKRYQAGQSPSRILTDFGYDVDALGKRRVQAIRDHIRKEAASPEGLYEGNAPCWKRRPHSTDYSAVPKDQAVELMQHELLYLRQEMEFVKKNHECGQFSKAGEVTMGKAGVKFEVIREVLSQHENELSVSLLCEIAGVSRSGYYSWLKAEGARQAREEKDRADFALVLEAYRFRGYQKGARSIYMRLLHSDPPVQMNVKKIRRLMDKYGLFCPIRKANPYRRMAKALKTSNVAGNLLNREFEAHGARKVLLTDITCVPYHGTFCYLSTILDAFTKQVLAYRVSESLEIDFVLETVHSLVREHRISLSAETLIHSDQGCHYTTCQFIQIVRDAQLRQSMSRKGNCWDNAPQESFFGHMKDEVDLSGSKDFPDAKAVIDDWIDYYNNDRYQWQLARLSPNEYYTYIMTGDYPLKLIGEPASGRPSDSS